jgi:hypothetical protein
MIDFDLYIGLLYKGGEFGLKELSGGNYRRVEMTNMDWLLTEDESEIVNVVDCKYPTATKNWESVYAFGVWDDPTDGSLLLVCQLERGDIGVPKGCVANFHPGFLTITLKALGVKL